MQKINDKTILKLLRKEAGVIKWYEHTSPDGQRRLWISYNTEGQTVNKNIEAFLAIHRGDLDRRIEEKTKIEQNKFSKGIPYFSSPRTPTLLRCKEDNELTLNEQRDKKTKLKAKKLEIENKDKIVRALTELGSRYDAGLLTNLSLTEEHATGGRKNPDEDLEAPGGHKKLVKTRVALAKATNTIYEQHNKGISDKNRIDFCRDYLKKNSIKGRKTYTPEKLNNAVSKYAEKIKNKQRPKK